MATLTPLVTDTTGTVVLDFNAPTDWVRFGGAWVEGSTSTAQSVEDNLSQAITSSVANGDTGIGQPAGGNSTAVVHIPLTDVDADFDSMLTLGLRVSGAQLPSPDDYVDDLGQLQISVYDSTASTAYTYTLFVWDFDGNSWSAAGAPSYNYGPSLTLTAAGLAASKADWNSAILVVQFSDYRSMGSDAATIILVDFEITGTYTPIPASLPPLQPNARYRHLLVR